jgi:serine/threonine protein kinase
VPKLVRLPQFAAVIIKRPSSRKTHCAKHNSAGCTEPCVPYNGATMRIGRQLGSYHLEAQIGAGGMGSVYRALDTRLNRPVAIKVLSDDIADAAGRRRFQREAQMASSVNATETASCLQPRRKRRLPSLPQGGIRSPEDIDKLPGAKLLPAPGEFPGPGPSLYAFPKFTSQRNIYRVPVP